MNGDLIHKKSELPSFLCLSWLQLSRLFGSVYGARKIVSVRAYLSFILTAVSLYAGVAFPFKIRSYAHDFTPA